MKLTRFLTLSAALLGASTAAQAQLPSKLAGANASSTAQPSQVAPVPAPTIITTAPYTISKPGYYQLGADLTVTNTTGNIITIAASNVTLDFGGHYISGPGNATATSTLYGVNANEQGNITVMNGTIAFCYEGVAFFGNGNAATTLNINQTVQNMLVTYVSHVGINFQSAFYSKATDNTVSNIGGATAANGTGNYGFFGQGMGLNISRNSIVKVTGPSNSVSSAFGIFVPSEYTVLAVGNQIFNVPFGIVFEGTGKYQDNLTLNVTTPFTGGTAVGNNN